MIFKAFSERISSPLFSFVENGLVQRFKKGLFLKIYES